VTTVLVKTGDRNGGPVRLLLCGSTAVSVDASPCAGEDGSPGPRRWFTGGDVEHGARPPARQPRRSDRNVGAVIGDLLPLAVGIAISPMPIMAVILMLLSRRAATASTGLLIGWILGVVAVPTIALVLVGQAGNTSSGQPSTLSSILKLVFGVALLLMAAKQWRGRPQPGQPATMPKWMAAIESFTLLQALGVGIVMSGINPKNLLLCLSAGTTIGAAHLSIGGDIVALMIFVVLSSSTVGVPVVAYLFARSRIQPVLEGLRAWLTDNNAAVMAVLLLVIGVALVGKGIGGLTG
jgi:hypothetical protein